MAPFMLRQTCNVHIKLVMSSSLHRFVAVHGRLYSYYFQPPPPSRHRRFHSVVAYTQHMPYWSPFLRIQSVHFHSFTLLFYHKQKPRRELSPICVTIKSQSFCFCDIFKRFFSSYSYPIELRGPILIYIMLLISMPIQTRNPKVQIYRNLRRKFPFLNFVVAKS